MLRMQRGQRLSRLAESSRGQEGASAARRGDGCRSSSPSEIAAALPAGQQKGNLLERSRMTDTRSDLLGQISSLRRFQLLLGPALVTLVYVGLLRADRQRARCPSGPPPEHDKAQAQKL